MILPFTAVSSLTFKLRIISPHPQFIYIWHWSMVLVKPIFLKAIGLYTKKLYTLYKNCILMPSMLHLSVLHLGSSTYHSILCNNLNQPCWDWITFINAVLHTQLHLNCNPDYHFQVDQRSVPWTALSNENSIHTWPTSHCIWHWRQNKHAFMKASFITQQCLNT